MRFKLANLMAYFDAMTALVQRKKEDIRKSLSILFTKAQKTYENTVKAVMLEVEADLVDV